ncbi:MAG: CDP-alcohol phosphatidyltransferase family protein, partial [Mycetocola sp.]
IPALHLAVLIYLWRWPDRDSDAALLVPLVYSVVASTTFFAMILNDQLKRSAGVAESIVQGGSSPLRSVVLLPTDYGVFCAVFLLLGIPVMFLPVYVLFFAANALFLVLALVRWFRVMRAVDTTRSDSAHA